MVPSRRPGLRDVVRRIAAAAAVEPEERMLAGWVAGWLYTLGGITLTLFLVLPRQESLNVPLLVAVVANALFWGQVQVFVVRWNRAPGWLIHLPLAWSLVLIAGAMAATGGLESSAWVYLFFLTVAAAYFIPRRFAYLYLAACVLTHALPLLYGSGVSHSHFLGQFTIAAPAYVVFGIAILAGKDLMTRLRRRAEGLAELQGALRRIATAVVGGEPAEQIYAIVARELAVVHHGAGAGVLRLRDEVTAEVVGGWAERRGGFYDPGTVVEVPPGSSVAEALRCGRSFRINVQPEGTPARNLGYEASIAAPIYVAGEVWGAFVIMSTLSDGLTAADELKLSEFSDLVSTAIASLEDRAKLAAQARSDPLTGLANHRTLQERLAAEIARATRHDRPLAVAVIDIDQFKLINDLSGHAAGDAILVKLARCLESLARSEDILGRVGGDEFAWVMPETDRERALVAVERARTMLARVTADTHQATVSAGICDIKSTRDPAELLRFADGALYWSKAHGRNQCWIYDATVIEELSVQERAEHLERSQALLGLRALARAIDAKDPGTREHSDRVSRLVGRLAEAAGWGADRARLLRDAALVHDVGKIGVPDAVLRKVLPLSDEERSQITHHAELSARIVDGVLAAEQVEWIRTHHERPDGLGYPDGLTEPEIQEGAALLSLADAWDVMTTGRPYSAPKPIPDAIEEVVALTGRQFKPAAARALLALHARGELEPVADELAARAC